MSDYQKYEEILLKKQEKQVKEIIELRLDEARKEFGGSAVYVPKLSVEQREQRNKAISDLRTAGYSIDYICRKFNLSSKQVSRVLANKKTKNTLKIDGLSEEELDMLRKQIKFEYYDCHNSYLQIAFFHKLSVENVRIIVNELDG